MISRDKASKLEIWGPSCYRAVQNAPMQEQVIFVSNRIVRQLLLILSDKGFCIKVSCGLYILLPLAFLLYGCRYGTVRYES